MRQSVPVGADLGPLQLPELLARTVHHYSFLSMIPNVLHGMTVAHLAHCPDLLAGHREPYQQEARKHRAGKRVFWGAASLPEEGNQKIVLVHYDRGRSQHRPSSLDNKPVSEHSTPCTVGRDPLRLSSGS